MHVLMLVVSMVYIALISGKSQRQYHANTSSQNISKEVKPRRTRSIIPQFMLDVYNVIADESGYTREGAPDLGKTINGIYAKDSSRRDTIPGKFSYKFNLSVVKNISSIRRVELRVYKTMNKKNVRRKGRLFYRTDITLNGYNFIRSRSTMVSAAGYGWQSFDITKISSDFIRDGDDDLSISIKVRPIRSMLPLFEFVRTSHDSTRALLVVYSDSNANALAMLRALRAEEVTHSSVINTRVRRSLTSTSCALRSMSLKLSHHKVFKGVIIPRKVKINRCEGSCVLPYGSNANVIDTYHARLMRLIMFRRMERNDHRKRKVIHPSCSPHKLRDMAILKRNVGNTYTEIILPKAIVASCMCV